MKWTEWGRLGLDEKKIIEECEQRIESEEGDSENPLVQEDIDSIIGTQYVTNNVLSKIIEKLKYNDKVKLHDNKLYILARRAYCAGKEGKGTAREWRKEAVGMVTRVTNWQDKKHYFVIPKIGQVNHMRLEHIEFRVGRFYILDPMQGEPRLKIT